jgi:2-polyprenyl-3-methyl-5-hydroxy-6-metoxy-1,4-benzoquinol methylase
VSSLPSPTSEAFLQFANKMSDPALIARLASSAEWEPDALAKRVSIALGEVGQTLQILTGVDVADGAHLLEVGAGLGLTSAFLSTCGFEISALEPAGLGFEEHEKLAANVASVVGSEHRLLPIGAADLNVSAHGTFDLVFSSNVLEHIDDPVAALRSMLGVLSPTGLMVHSCPNYSLPFDPHFSLPLLPIRPSWTAKVLPSSISSSDVWKSLNFITARKVRRWARELGLTTNFRSGALAASIERLGTDAEFRSRHRALAVLGRVLVTSRMTSLIRRLPATWSTPMDFVMSVPGTDQDRVAAWLDALD